MKIYAIHNPWDGPIEIVSADAEKEGPKFWTLSSESTLEGFWGTKIPKGAAFLTPEDALLNYMQRLSGSLNNLRDQMTPLENRYAQAKALLLMTLEGT